MPIFIGAVDVGVGDAVNVAVALGVAVAVFVTVGVAVEVAIGVTVELGVAVSSSSPPPQAGNRRINRLNMTKTIDHRLLPIIPSLTLCVCPI